MELVEFKNYINETSEITVSEEQAAIILASLNECGYTLENKDNKLSLHWVDQAGEMKKDVTLNQIITFVADQKYQETINIMDGLDEIKTISVDNIGTYCSDLTKLIEKEKELHLIEEALLQTERFIQLKQMIDTIPKNNTKKITR